MNPIASPALNTPPMVFGFAKHTFNHCWLDTAQVGVELGSGGHSCEAFHLKVRS